MANWAKRLTACMLTAAMLLGMACGGALADGLEFAGMGKKEAEALAQPGEYEITVSVPGAVKTDKYSEIIVMVDASSSQGANLDKLKTTLVDIADKVLHNDGSVRLTLMGFGMGPKNVGSFYNAETLESYLAGVTQADLRQGVSATNCEAALDFVREYIELSERLEKTAVIFTSDGMTNMDETAFKLTDWKEHPEWYMSGATPVMIASYAAGGQADLLLSGGHILTPTAELFPQESQAVAMAKAQYGMGSDQYNAAVDALYNKITETEDGASAYLTAVYKAVIRADGKEPDSAYSTSDYEKAFLNYYDGVMMNSYLCAIHGMKNAAFYPDWYNLGTWGGRAAEAADKLAANGKVLQVHVLDFANKVNTWMNPDSTTNHHVTSGKIQYHTASNYQAAVDQMLGVSMEVFETVYADVTVVDPMSKWVTLDPSTIRIYNGDTLVYRYGEGWLISDPPTAEPITLTQDGDQYQITWKIKDGPLYYTDRYSLKYVVNVDETEAGFEYGAEYPANGPTYVEYTDENGNEQTKDVTVPQVKENLPPDDFAEGEKGITIIKEDRESGKGISGIQFSIYKVVPVEGLVMNSIPGAEEIAAFKTSENFVATIETDGTGYAAYNFTKHGLEDGLYMIVEHENAKVTAPVDPFYVRIPMPDPVTGEMMNVVQINPKNELKPVEEELIPPVTPDDTVEDEELGRFTILKHDAASESTVLAGAEFAIYKPVAEGTEGAEELTYGEDQKVWAVPVNTALVVTGANGMATSGELDFGLYFLVETKAPAGYNLLEKAIPVWVTETSYLDENAVKIPNEAGFFLPETGGRGTVAIMMAGVALCGAAIVLLARKKARA